MDWTTARRIGPRHGGLDHGTADGTTAQLSDYSMVEMYWLSGYCVPLIGKSLDDEAGFVCLNLAIVVTSESNIHKDKLVCLVGGSLVGGELGFYTQFTDRTWRVNAAADSCNLTQTDLLGGSLGDDVDLM